MKFTSYAVRRDGTTLHVFGGAALDMDTEGGLEELLEGHIKAGVKRIVLTMRGMRFFHYTLFAGLLATERRLQEVKGDLVLAEVPWFVAHTLHDLGLLHRFALVPNSQTVERAERLKVDLNSLPTGMIPG